MGSLSHLLNAKAGGYQELPDWPESAPDPSVRNVEVKESVRAVEAVTYRDTGALWVLRVPLHTEESEGCSFSRAVTQRGWMPELHIQNNLNSNTSQIPLLLTIIHSFTDHHHQHASFGSPFAIQTDVA